VYVVSMISNMEELLLRLDNGWDEVGVLLVLELDEISPDLDED
jgi:hypothetical protein